MIKLTINQEVHHLEVDTAKPLLWVLREDLSLTGTKFSCGQGICGACTVHIDGQAIRSCITPVGQVKGAITTIEGLSAHGDHPLQQAWIKHNVMQCGYCQPGQLMTAAALLNNNPKPNKEQIRAGMAANLCRCGTYPRIEKAIADVVDQSDSVNVLG